MKCREKCEPALIIWSFFSAAIAEIGDDFYVMAAGLADFLR